MLNILMDRDEKRAVLIYLLKKQQSLEHVFFWAIGADISFYSL